MGRWLKVTSMTAAPPPSPARVVRAGEAGALWRRRVDRRHA